MQAQPISINAGPTAKTSGRFNKIHWLILGAIVLALLGAALYNQSGKLTRKVSSLDPQPARQQVPIDKEMDKPTGVPAQAVANAAQAAAVSALEPAALTTSAQNNMVAPNQDTAQILARLSKIEAAIDGLSNAITKLSADFAAWVVTSHAKPNNVTEVKAIGKPMGTSHKKLRRKTAPRTPIPSGTKEQPTATQNTERAPEVLSIDTWNGQTSVVVRNGSKVQFLREGEHAGAYMLKRADKEGQRAFFVDPSGTLTVKERAER